MKKLSPNKTFKFILPLLLVTLAGSRLAWSQEQGSLDSLTAGFTGQQSRDQNIAVKDSLELGLNAMLELEMYKDFPLSQSYNTLEGFGWKRRQAGLSSLWRQNNADFLAKPAADRTGEGLIPDINVPLPGIGKLLGSGAQIKINGSEKMIIGGQQTDNYGQVNTVDGTTSFALKIKQEQQINLEGIIGERLHVLIDWNSEALTDKKSKIRLYYEGKDDEILQRLEAGDTEFSLAGSNLIGQMTTQHKGLFGIKGVAKLGGLEVTAIASKDEGQNETKSFVGQSQLKENKVNDRDFIAHRFFWIPLADEADSIDNMLVYVNSDNQSQTTAIQVYGINCSWLDFSTIDTTSDILGCKAIEKKVIEEYSYERIIGGRGYLLSLKYGLQANDVLLVSYKTKKGVSYPDSTLSGGQAKLAIIKPSNCLPPNGVIPNPLHGFAWNYELRNFYNIGSSNIVESSLNIKIKKRTTGSESDFLERDSVSKKRFTYLTELSDSNGVINFQNLRLSEGYFYFNLKYPPYLSRPFDHESLQVKNPAIYDSLNLEKVTPQYQIVVSYLTNEAVYALDVPGQLIEGSVQATISGETVPSNQYEVDYETGTVTFSEAYKEKIKQPGSQLNITYQFMPWASFGTKTLAGLRGIYKFNEQAQLGGTWLYRSEQSLETKPRLGEEPTRMIVAGLDGFYKANPGFLTNLVNYLPGIETEAPSNFEITGEAAANFPNPNTKGEVYLDDMDGTKLTDGLNLYRQGWVYSSLPADTRFPKTAAQLSQKTFWYNPTAKVTQGEINPAITDETLKKDPVTTIKLHHQPDTISGPRLNSWTGITQLLSKNGIDLSQSKLLNVWVRTSSAARLHIDFGREISMDQVRRDAWGNIKGRPDTVDAEPLTPGDQQIYIDANDIGLDSTKLPDNQATPASKDDGNDDFLATDSTKCNGTEGNGIYDTEDLKLSGKAPGEYSKQNDSYYTFTFDLSDSNSWLKFSIPLDSANAVGYPYGWGNIYYARVWVDRCTTASAEVELALVEISGNRWQEKPIVAASGSDSVDISEKFYVTVKNNKDDADYIPPPNAVETDEQGSPKFEQSLALIPTYFKPGHLALAQRNTNTRENNYTGYKKLKVWVKGKTGVGRFLIRLASNADSSSPYYQYTGPLSSGWQELTLNLEDLSSLKKLTPDSLGFRQQGAYAVKGTPNLANIGALYLGAINQDTLIPLYTDEVWFDNLRLDEVRRDRGTAVIASVRLGVADLMTLSLGYDRRDAYWYTMDQGKPLLPAQRVSYNIGGTLNLDKFFLNRLGLTVPVSFGASLVESYPWYGGDDRKLTPQESSEQMEWTRARDISFSLSKKQSGWWLTNLTIDRMAASLNWVRNTYSTRTSSDSTTTLNTSLNWGWASGARKSLGIGNWLKLYYLPSNLSFALGNNRTWRWNLDKQVNAVSTAGTGLSRGGSASLGWQIADPLSYHLTTNRNLLQRTGAGELAWKYGLGAEVSRTQSVEYHTTITWLKIIQPTFNYNTNYSLSHRPYLVPGAPDSQSFKDVSNANNLSLNGNLEVAKWLVKITALRNEAKDDSSEAGTPMWLVIQLEKMLKKINPLDISFSQSKTNSSSGLNNEPDLLYQLGWYRKPRSAESYAPLAQDRAGITNSYSASTGASLGQLSVNAGWQRSDSWNWDPTSSISSQATTWPDIRVTLNSVERIFKRVKILTSASLTSNYSQRQDKSSQAGRGVTRWNINHSFSPMISLNTRWRKQVSTQASFDYSTTDSRIPSDLAKYASGWEKDYTRNLKISASGSYSFSAPQGFVLNMWKMGKKRFKFKSDLNLGLQASYANNISAPNLDLNEPISREKYDSEITEISISPNATYNFTRNIKGELTGSYTNRTDKIRSTSNSRSYSLNTTVTITF